MYDIRNLNIWKPEPEKNHGSSEYLDTDITELNLSVRSYNCLKRAGCNTVGQIIERINSEENGLRRIRNLGSRSEEEIRKAIEQYQDTCTSQSDPSDECRIIKRSNIRSAERIWDADIEEFHLSDYALTRLRQNGIHQVRDLYATNPKNEPGWYAVRELLEKIPSLV